MQLSILIEVLTKTQDLLGGGDIEVVVFDPLGEASDVQSVWTGDFMPLPMDASSAGETTKVLAIVPRPDEARFSE